MSAKTDEDYSPPSEQLRIANFGWNKDGEYVSTPTKEKRPGLQSISETEPEFSSPDPKRGKFVPSAPQKPDIKATPSLFNKAPSASQPMYPKPSIPGYNLEDINVAEPGLTGGGLRRV